MVTFALVPASAEVGLILSITGGLLGRTPESMLTPNESNTTLIGLPIVMVLLPANSNATGLLLPRVTIKDPESPPLLKAPRVPETMT